MLKWEEKCKEVGGVVVVGGWRDGVWKSQFGLLVIGELWGGIGLGIITIDEFSHAWKGKMGLMLGCGLCVDIIWLVNGDCDWMGMIGIIMIIDHCPSLPLHSTQWMKLIIIALNVNKKCRVVLVEDPKARTHCVEEGVAGGKAQVVAGNKVLGHMIQCM